MKSSLSLRLMIAAVLSTVVALAATGFVLNLLFRGYFEDRIKSEIEAFLVQLTSGIALDANDQVVVSGLSDPRFLEPLSGFIWQVQMENDAPVVSPSFWSSPLELERPETFGDITFQSVGNPDGEHVLAGSWVVTLSAENTAKELLLTVAVDQSQLNQSAAGFSRNVLQSMGILGAFLILAAWFQVRIGLKPLEKVRVEVNKVMADTGSRLSRDYPSEVLPLVDEVNNLLDLQDTTIDRARARASDLAHGLKTPLTIMRAISQDVKKVDEHEIAADIESQIENMQHFVERELARTRDGTGKQVWSVAVPIVEKLVSSMQRHGRGPSIKWRLSIGPKEICPFDEYALTELLGNLIDNAMKWTQDEISIAVAGNKSTGFIKVEDNGPGIPKDNLDSVLMRGKQLDQERQGQGLGLAIVLDMTQTRGAKFSVLNRAGGGLTALVEWNFAAKEIRRAPDE